LRFAHLWSPRIVSAFYPLPGEPDTLRLLGRLADHRFPTALPTVVGRGSPLVFRLWRQGDPVRVGAMSITEPGEGAPVVAPDLLFVPLACFDRRGRRIGYGAGFYDRTLALLRAAGSLHAVGVAFAICEVDAVPHEAHDQSLDAVVTERETMLFDEQ
jgi:5-formyltetrahydrofolate cyclo-ligase